MTNENSPRLIISVMNPKEQKFIKEEHKVIQPLSMIFYYADAVDDDNLLRRVGISHNEITLVDERLGDEYPLPLEIEDMAPFLSEVIAERISSEGKMVHFITGFPPQGNNDDELKKSERLYHLSMSLAKSVIEEFYDEIINDTEGSHDDKRVKEFARKVHNYTVENSGRHLVTVVTEPYQVLQQY